MRAAAEPIRVNEASIATASVTIRAVTINKKQMTLSVFRQLPVIGEDDADLDLDDRDGSVNDWGNIEPWGIIRYLTEDAGTWLLATMDGDLVRMALRRRGIRENEAKERLWSLLTDRDRAATTARRGKTTMSGAVDTWRHVLKIKAGWPEQYKDGWPIEVLDLASHLGVGGYLAEFDGVVALRAIVLDGEAEAIRIMDRISRDVSVALGELERLHGDIRLAIHALKWLRAWNRFTVHAAKTLPQLFIAV